MASLSCNSIFVEHLRLALCLGFKIKQNPKKIFAKGTSMQNQNLTWHYHIDNTHSIEQRQ